MTEHRKNFYSLRHPKLTDGWTTLSTTGNDQPRLLSGTQASTQ